MFHSTPQQTTGKIRKHGQLKSSHNPQTPGGSAFSPIVEERRDDLDKLVSKLRGGAEDKIVHNLVTQLRNLIAQWDWAQARHRHVAKIYFERQQDELNSNWENLHSEMAKFNQQKSDEWARIASIRSGLQSDKAKATAKKDSDRIKELELQLQKQKSKDLLSSQKLSELRTKIKELEGEVNVREKSYNENMLKIKRCEQQLVRAEQENSNLRTKLTLMKAEKQQQSLAAFQQNPQRSNHVGPRATLFNVCHSNQQSNRIETSRINSTSSSICDGSSTSSIQPAFIRRNNSDNSFLNTQRQQQCYNSRNNRSLTDNGQNIQSARPRVHFADEPINVSFPASSLTHSMSSNNEDVPSLNKRFELPSEMVNTMYQITKRGREFTFSDGNNQIIVVELLGCKQPPQCRHCLLYEYPSKFPDENSNSNDFRWISLPLLPIFNSNVKKHKVEINFRQKNNFYEIQTPIGNVVRFFLSGQLEVCWKCGDRTLVLPNGERREVFGPEKPDFRMEIYLPNGTAFRLNASNQWQREEFAPTTSRMSVRPDGSYSSLHVQQSTQAESTSMKLQDMSSLQINAPDFKLRRFNSTKAIKMAIEEPSLPGASLQLWFCIDDVLLVKHIQDVNANNEKGICEQKQREKSICFSRGECKHIRTATNGGNADRTMSFAMMQ